MLTVMQINIRCWKTNRYVLSTSLCDTNPDIILINETGESENIYLQGYQSIQKSNTKYSGVAILISKSIQFTEIPLIDDNVLAIKILTSEGPMHILTAYSPPRESTIPIISINKILNFNLPTLIMADLNAHHPLLHNTRNNNGNKKGQQIAALMKTRNLHFLGPYFPTFVTKNNQSIIDSPK